MYKKANFETAIADAEEALRKAEEANGKDHLSVSYCLDEIVRLLNSNGVRRLDAVNMEARARAIRIKHNSSALSSVSSEVQEISESIKVATQRHKQSKARRNRLLAIVACVCLAFVGKVMFAPSPSELKAREAFMKTANEINPATMVKNMLDKGKTAAKEVEEANKKHNDEIEKFMQ
jgi:hypothetical protein